MVHPCGDVIGTKVVSGKEMDIDSTARRSLIFSSETIACRTGSNDFPCEDPRILLSSTRCMTKGGWAFFYTVADLHSRFLDFVQAEKSRSLKTAEYEFIRF